MLEGICRPIKPRASRVSKGVVLEVDGVEGRGAKAEKYETEGVRSKEKVDRAGEGVWHFEFGYGITSLEKSREGKGDGRGVHLGLGAGDAAGDRVIRRVAPLNALLVGIGSALEERA